MSAISNITLPDGQTYGIKDADAQERIAAIESVIEAISEIPDPKASVISCQAAIKAILDAARAL